MLTIDGITYKVKCDIQRTAEVTASDISGMMLDGSYFNDVIGTYLQYYITFTYPLWDRDKYASIFEVLTQPVDGHTFVLPYNNSTVQITGMVEEVSDEYIKLEHGRSFWKSTKFRVTALHPTKQATLSDVLTRGRAPLPDVAAPEIGDTYTYTADGWEKVTSNVSDH